MLARVSLDDARMARFLVVLLFFCVLFSPAPARAASVEDALFDGEVDPEDLLASAGSRRVGRAVVPEGAQGHAWVSLVGFTHRSTITDQREIGGMLVVGLPFDRIARASTRSSVEAVRTVAVDGGETTLALNARLARTCVNAAWRAAGLGADDARLDAIVSRAHWSALLPETRIRAVRFDDATLSTDTGTDSVRWRDASGANIGLEGRVTWRFDRLLYSDDEPTFERIKLERHDARAKIAARALEALFHWQRAWLDLRSLPPISRGTREEVDAALRVLEAEAALDVLTAGWFSSWRSQRVSIVVPEKGGDL